MKRSSQMPHESARKLFLAMFFTELLLVLFYWIDILLASPSPVLHALVDLDGGAVLETLGYKFFQGSVNPFLYQTEVCFEEFFEMLGASFLLYSMSSIACTTGRQRIQMGAPSGRNRAIKRIGTNGVCSPPSW